jgi:hypothetical protein
MSSGRTVSGARKKEKPRNEEKTVKDWKFPECNNGMRDRGLQQKLQGRKRIKDLDGRLPLCPRNERTSSWTYRKAIDSVKIAKEKAGSYAA